jgi:adenine deaminase
MFLYNPDNRRLVETALGDTPADMVIRDGTLADVYTGRMIPHRSIAVAGKWIAYVGQDADYTIGEKTRVIEAGGGVIAPGYVDSHTHLASFYTIPNFLSFAIPGGTTTYITEAEAYAFGLGAKGFGAFLEQIRNQPVKIFCLIPPMVTISLAARPLLITAEEARGFLQDELTIGLGESYWQNTILPPDDRILALIRETMKAGKSVQGHAAGATDRKLAAYAAAGVVSCHEAVSPEDVAARLEMGYGTMIREGYIRRDLESLRPLIGKIDMRRCTLSTDGTDPSLLLSQGYFADVVQKAVAMGLAPIEAIRMATLNPAALLGLDHLLGGIAPGRYADVIILPDPATMTPDLVLSAGKVVAKGGKVLVPLRQTPHPAPLYETIKAPMLRLGQFSVSASSCSQPNRVRTMDIQANGLVAREGQAEVTSHDGYIYADAAHDLLKAVFIERVSGTGERFIGFVRGWGMKQGAVATSLAWDASAIVAVGTNDQDLTAAINRVIELQGGTALVVDGLLRVEIASPIAGYLAEMRIEDLASALTDLQTAIAQLGTILPNAFLTLATMTSAAIPFIRITEKGYFRFRENDYVGI